MAQKLNPTQQSSELGYAEITGSQGSITGQTDITGLSITVNVPTGATLMLEVFVPQVYSTVGTDRADLGIREGGTNLGFAYNAAPVSSAGWGGASVKKRIQPSAGSHTYIANLTRGAGTGSLSTYADTTSRAWIQARIV